MTAPNPVYADWSKTLDRSRIAFLVSLVPAVLLLLWLPRIQFLLVWDGILGGLFFLLSVFQMRLRLNFSNIPHVFLVCLTLSVQNVYIPYNEGWIIGLFFPLQVVFGGMAIWTFLMLVFKNPLLRRLEKTLEADRE